MTQHIVDLAIVDMESAKSDVNGWKEKVDFLLLFIGKYEKSQIIIQKHINPINIGPRYNLYI